MAVVVRTERAADAAAVRRVLAAAFAGADGRVPGEVSLVDALRGGDAWLPGLSVLAERDGLVVAYALLSRVTVDGFPALALGPVAVLPGHQRAGHGSAVVRGALDRAVRHGERLVLVLGPPAYYGRFGFVPAARYGLTGTWSSAGDAWQALPLPPAAGPVPSGEVRHPAPWHAL